MVGLCLLRAAISLHPWRFRPRVHTKSMTSSGIPTKSLLLVPYAPAELRALYQGAEAFERCSGCRPAEGLADMYNSGEVRPEWFDLLQSATAPDPWVFGFALLHQTSRSVIGSAGFVGPPGPERVVEIAYGLVPEHQCKGYATEAAQALVTYAFASGLVSTVRAHTLPQMNASTRVLTKCGFSRVQDYVDPIDGLVWRWEKSAPSP